MFRGGLGSGSDAAETASVGRKREGNLRPQPIMVMLCFEINSIVYVFKVATLRCERNKRSR